MIASTTSSSPLHFGAVVAFDPGPIRGLNEESQKQVVGGVSVSGRVYRDKRSNIDSSRSAKLPKSGPEAWISYGWYSTKLDSPLAILSLSRSTQALASSSESCPLTLAWISLSNHFIARYFSADLYGGPLGCLNSKAVSMQSACRIFSALRSHSSE